MARADQTTKNRMDVGSMKNLYRMVSLPSQNMISPTIIAAGSIKPN